ncbi:MAG: hypothetical protein JSW52_09015 [Candidatus Coatesbacteria bacterium]|nr:MAG: hypothetical protein JSW52_09015 [Candidatus Coatesbacteria bacterium]
MVTRLAIILSAVFSVVPLIIGCYGDVYEQKGLYGHVYYKNGVTPVACATVTATPAGIEAAPDAPAGTYVTTSGHSGYYVIWGLPEAEYIVTADKGAFHAEARVTPYGWYEKNLLMEINDSEIGVVPGANDNVGVLLAALGYGYTTLTNADLADQDKLAPLGMLFLNCGGDTSYASNADVQNNLKSYVTDGGFLYASDYEFEYIEACWPDAISFYGRDPYIGDRQTIEARVYDYDLERYLGRYYTYVTFDHSEWVVIDDVDESTDVLVRGSFDTSEDSFVGKPLLVSFYDGNGIVIYTCFHDWGKNDKDIFFYIISLPPAS